MPTWSWSQHDVYDEIFKSYAICGPSTHDSIDVSVFDTSCTRATVSCGSDLKCVRDTMVQNFTSGEYKFCPNQFNLLINPNPGEVGWYGHGPIGST